MSNWEIIEACEREDYVKIKTMVEADSSCLMAYDLQGRTPLHLLLISGLDEMIRYLVEKGANIYMKDTEHGASAIHFSATGGSPDIIEYLLDLGMDSNEKKNDGYY